MADAGHGRRAGRGTARGVWPAGVDQVAERPRHRAVRHRARRAKARRRFSRKAAWTRAADARGRRIRHQRADGRRFRRRSAPARPRSRTSWAATSIAARCWRRCSAGSPTWLARLRAGRSADVVPRWSRSRWAPPGRRSSGTTRAARDAASPRASTARARCPCEPARRPSASCAGEVIWL